MPVAAVTVGAVSAITMRVNGVARIVAAPMSRVATAMSGVSLLMAAVVTSSIVTAAVVVRIVVMHVVPVPAVVFMMVVVSGDCGQGGGEESAAYESCQPLRAA